jgi:type IV secretory pathway VirB4 component
MRENPLGDKRGTLESAVKQAHERRGITRDPETHGEESPTVEDVIEVLTDMAEDPEEHAVSEAEEEHETIASNASDLLIGLEPFTEGAEFAHLARETEIDIGESDVVYLDLQQQETRGGTGLMMQLLFNAVYERAKEETDKRVVFAIDEARYIMKDAANLGFLEQAVRHSRHYDLSIQFVTQTSGEFALSPEARTIANLCSLTLIHRVAEAGETLREWFDLNERELDWVQTAAAGDHETGYSEALLGIDEEGWFPLRVRASEIERSVIETGQIGDGTAGTHRTRPEHQPSTGGEER